jgi:DNA-dependent metalloprotease WSS1
LEVKKEEDAKKSDNDLVTDSEADDGDEDDTAIKFEPGDAVDNNGEPLLDNQGRNMVKVCDEEDNNDEDAKLELLELRNMKNIDIHDRLSRPSLLNHPKPDSLPKPRPKSDEQEIMKLPPESRSDQLVTQPGSITKGTISKAKEDESQRTSVLSCPVCSVQNESVALTCLVCSNVLQPQAIPNSWQCDSSTCRDSKYINAGDVGLCGVCGTRKCSN